MRIKIASEFFLFSIRVYGCLYHRLTQRLSTLMTASCSVGLGFLYQCQCPFLGYLLRIKGSLTAPLITLLLCFAIILIVMPYYDSIDAAANATGTFTPQFSSKIGALTAVVAIAVIAFLILRSFLKRHLFCMNNSLK